MLLPILIGATLFCLGLILVGVKKGDDELSGMGLGTGICVVFFGWLMLGMLLPQKTTNVETTAHVLHDKDAVHLSVDGAVVKSYNDVANFNFLADKSEVKAIKTENFNMYGGSVSVQWNLANKQ